MQRIPKYSIIVRSANKEMRCMKKYRLFIILAILLIAVLIYVFDSRRERSFSEVTQRLSEQVATVKDMQGNMVAPEKYEDMFLKGYTLWRGEIGSTAHLVWNYYDKEENILFKLTFLGNRNLVRITIGEGTKTYRYQ